MTDEPDADIGINGAARFILPAEPWIRASARAVTEMLVARFQDLRAFDQQSMSISATGPQVTRGQLTKWANEAAGLLATVAAGIAQAGMRVPVLSSANLSLGIAGEQSRRLWLFMSTPPVGPADPAAPPLMWLRLTPDRGGGFAGKELSAFRGILQAPAFSGYDRQALRHDIRLVDCWRQVEDETRMIQLVAPHPFLDELTRFFPRLRETEAHVVDEPAPVRAGVRQQALRLPLDRLRHQLDLLIAQTNPRLPLGAFANDLGSRWAALTAFLGDGRIGSENLALQKIRVLGAHSRRWVFGRHEESRKSAAVLYTIIGTCELNGVDPRQFIRAALARLIHRGEMMAGDSPMPWAFAERLASTQVEASSRSGTQLGA